MRRFLLDTGIAADFVHGRHGVFERAKSRTAQGDRVGICVPVLGELWSGVCLSQTRERNEARLLRRLNDLIVWPYDSDAAWEFGNIFAFLQKKGRPIQQIDIQIAAIATSLGNCTVVTKDSDFTAIPGLDIVDWTQTG